VHRSTYNICIRILIFVEVLPNKCTTMMPSSVPQTSRVRGRLYLFDQRVTLRWPFVELIGGKTA
jgi:hypothetical protein